MQHLDNRLILSATDLINYLECPYLTDLDMEIATGQLELEKTDAGAQSLRAPTAPPHRTPSPSLFSLDNPHDGFAAGGQPPRVAFRPCLPLTRVLDQTESRQSLERLGCLAFVPDARVPGHLEIGCPGIAGDRGEHPRHAVGDPNVRRLAHPTRRRWIGLTSSH
jgi:hypothetical protein